MKTKLFILAFFVSLFASAQDRTTVTATTSDISDNLDLRAVASIFGDSDDLEDFERRLNDPRTKVSNLDLNNDRQVDYLRVIESVEGSTHLIVIQSVLDRDVFQDVATVEVEKDRHNNVQVQVVGDVYMYGPNYIYEPVYSYHPAIYNTFWVRNYRPYWSGWYWNYYPSYYYAWNPYPVYYYQNNVNLCINSHHHYNYVNYRRSQRAIALHNSRRATGYESMYPNRSFVQRNSGFRNRHEMETATNVRNTGTRSEVAAGTRSGVRNTASNTSIRNTGSGTTSIRQTANAGTASQSVSVTAPVRNTVRGTRSEQTVSTPRPVRSETSYTTPRNESNVWTSDNASNAESTPVRSEYTNTRQYSGTRTATPINTRAAEVRNPVRNETRSAIPSSRASQQSAPQRGNAFGSGNFSGNQVQRQAGRR